ncbi:MAG: DsbA family protein [Patescibacteria group bacterium]
MEQRELKLPNAIFAVGVLLSASIILHAVIIKGSVELPTLKKATTEKQNVIAPTDTVNVGENTPTVPATIDDDPILGNKDAKVTIIEFSDFQCPFCKRLFDAAVVNIKKDYIDTGKARLVFRDFPLSFHPNAEISAIAGECADEQGKFWNFHDMLFTKQDDWSPLPKDDAKSKFGEYAQSLGMNVGSFNNCVSSEKYKDEVQKDSNDGSASGVSGTPTLFINGKTIVGAQPYETIKAAIEEALK